VFSGFGGTAPLVVACATAVAGPLFSGVAFATGRFAGGFAPIAGSAAGAGVVAGRAAVGPISRAATTPLPVNSPGLAVAAIAGWP